MTTPRTPPARRRWIALDPRLAIGLVLVIASVAGVVALVSGLDQTVQVYAARDPLAPGDLILPADLESMSVRLDDASDIYLVPGAVPADGLVVTKSVAPGELVPTSAVGSVDGLSLTSMVLAPGGQLAASLGPGSVVDVWAAREGEGGVFGAPTVIVAGAIVVRLVESDSIVAAAETTGIEVLVPRTKIARVLETIANNDAVSVVLASLPAG